MTFIERRAALVPKPRAHQVTTTECWRRRRAGVRIVPVPVVAEEAAEPLPDEGSSPSTRLERARPKRYGSAELMRRVFELEVLPCARCGSRRKLIALITDLAVARRILRYFSLPSEPPAVAPGRPPPHTSLAF